jgi:hypothetical protein
MEYTFYGIKITDKYNKAFAFLCETAGGPMWKNEDLWQIRMIRSREIAEKVLEMYKKEVYSSTLSIIEIKITI